MSLRARAGWGPAVMAVCLWAPPAAAQPAGLSSTDLPRLASVTEVEISPEGGRIAYAVRRADRADPYTETWVLDRASGRRHLLGGASGSASGARWAPDGRRIAYFGEVDGQFGIVVAVADGSEARLLATTTGTNHPLPSTGERLTWSPDGDRLAFVSATPGPAAEQVEGDPLVISRYLYKPRVGGGSPRFNDNRRTHIFVAEISTGRVEQLTRGNFYEHSIAWSPAGNEIAFVSNRERDPDRVFNYDLFVVRVDDGSIRRLTDTPSAEYRPRWSPDGRSIAYQGTTRSLTSSETTMEDTHVWLIDADGENRRELGGTIDNRQGPPRWSADGATVYFTVQARGNVHLFGLPVTGGAPRMAVVDRGRVGAWSLASEGAVAYAFTTATAPAELYLGQVAGGAADRLTSLNDALLGERTIAEVEAFSFKSSDGLDLEAFLTVPIGRAETSRSPLIVSIHGGPHGQQGAAFNATAQVFAAQGWATLMVNYRGSTGYGQALTDAIFKDQNGREAQDVLAGIDAALERYSWLDGTRLGIEGGSYGGQLTNWIITQTDRFAAAIPRASIANLVSFNYMSYYHDYLAVEFGGYPHEGNLIDLLWERSPVRHATRVRTPTMLVHGEEDNNVPIAEAEQFFMALQDAGVETVMVRYPREGHGIREPAHQVDLLDRSVEWYRRHFEGAGQRMSPRP